MAAHSSPTKKHSSTNVKQHHELPQLQTLIVIAVGILALVVVVCSFFIYALAREAEQSSANRIGQLVVNAVDNLSTPIPIDAQTGKLFVAQTKLVLPPNTLSLPVEYRYWEGDKANPAGEVHIPDTVAALRYRALVLASSTTQKMFEEIPELQACTRGYTIAFAPQDSLENNKLVFTKQLADGRTLYAYRDKGCPNYSVDLEDYLKQFESY